jgi:hypothetical protein
MVFIHYGNNAYDPTRILPVKNMCQKPWNNTCLWGSPVCASYGWPELVNDSDLDKRLDLHFEFVFKPDKPVFVVNSKSDFLALPLTTLKTIDFEALVKSGCCGVYLTGEGFTDYEFWGEGSFITFWSWDCESVVVLDPNSIIVK